MKEDSMLMCLIAFVLGYLVSRMMRGNGLMVGGDIRDDINLFENNCSASLQEDFKINPGFCFNVLKPVRSMLNNYDVYDAFTCCSKDTGSQYNCLKNKKHNEILQKYWPEDGKDGIAIKNFYERPCENQNA